VAAETYNWIYYGFWHLLHQKENSIISFTVIKVEENHKIQLEYMKVYRNQTNGDY